jgi:hypothetical protein
MPTDVEEIKFILRIGSLVYMFVIIQSNVLRITVLQIWCQGDDWLLLCHLWRLHMWNDMVRIYKGILLLNLVNHPSFVAVSLNGILLHLLFCSIVKVANLSILHIVIRVILSIAFLKYGMVHFWLPYLHNSRWRTQRFLLFFQCLLPLWSYWPAWCFSIYT